MAAKGSNEQINSNLEEIREDHFDMFKKHTLVLRNIDSMLNQEEIQVEQLDLENIKEIQALIARHGDIILEITKKIESLNR